MPSVTDGMRARRPGAPLPEELLRNLRSRRIESCKAKLQEGLFKHGHAADMHWETLRASWLREHADMPGNSTAHGTARRPRAGHFAPCSYCGFGIARKHRQRCMCGATSYCDGLCQQRDWNKHKISCTCRKWLPVLRYAMRALPADAFKLVLHFVHKSKDDESASTWST